MFTQLIGFVVLVFAFGCEAKIDFPPYVKQCKRDDNVSACLKENFELCRPYLKEGIPKLQVPALGPLVLPEVGLENGEFSLSATDFTVHGLDGFELQDLKVDLKEPSIELKLTFPKIELAGNYKIKGKILILQLDGTGPMYGNITNIGGVLKINGHYVKKDGKDFISFDDTKVSIDKVENAFVDFQNLFGDNEELTKSTLIAVNENIHDFINELKPLFESTIGKVLESIIQRLFVKYSIDDLLA